MSRRPRRPSARRVPRARPPAPGRARYKAVALGASTATAAVIVLLVLLGLWLFYAPGPAAKPTTVILREGSGLTEIASTLDEAGAVGSASVFMAATQLSGAAKSLKAGEYLIPARASLASVLDRIRSGRVVRHYVTVPEGRTSEQAVAILMANPVLAGSAPAPPEGSILPETYEVRRGDDRAAVLQRMTDAQDRLLAQLWPKRQTGLPFKTQSEALTLASIVEKETAIPAERPRIAAVFVNRLRKGMRLESDPTIVYGLTKGQPLGRGIRLSELTTPTPYNTYFVFGLPPTPIANPGRAAIAAALDPPRTGELFFVANGEGGHVFAASFEQHQANVARWRQLERNQAAAVASSGRLAPSPLEPAATAGARP